MTSEQGDGQNQVQRPTALKEGANGKKIVFVRKHPAGHVELYATNADGIGEVRLTNSPGYIVGVSGFAWSPEGKKITFLRGSSIYLVEADGTGEILLTSNVCVLWNRMGEGVVFSREG